MIKREDIFWIAGFLEGEGSFSLSGGGRGARRTTPVVSAAQVQKEPLLRIHSLIGGNVRHCKGRPKNGGKASDYWRWSCGVNRSVGIMLTLFPLMSPKRKEQIKKATSAWRATLGSGEPNNTKTNCPAGHSLSGKNAYVTPEGWRGCKVCRRSANRKWRARARRNT